MFEFLKLAPDLQKLLQDGIEFYELSGGTEDVEAIATFIERASAKWNPTIKGQTFLDDPGTRRAGARFLAGIAVRVAKTPALKAAAERAAGRQA